MDDSIVTDVNYISAYSGDDTYWLESNYYSTEVWHSNWLNRIKTGTAGGVSQYGKLFSWYLMDEPYRAQNRDSVSNRYSVQGHSAFCSGIESTDSKPKQVAIVPSSETAWSNLSGNIDILCGDDYAYDLSNGSTLRYPWRTVNMTKWCKSRISAYSDKMVMAWLPGYANSNSADASVSGGSNTCWYTFYGSIIEGARGILWWMEFFNEYVSYQDQSGYNIVRDIYPAFTGNGYFKPGEGEKTRTRV